MIYETRVVKESRVNCLTLFPSIEQTKANGDANAHVENDFRPILCVYMCITFNTMLKLDGNVDTDVKCIVGGDLGNRNDII